MKVTRRSFLGSALALAALGAAAQSQELTADGFIELRAQRVTLDLLEGGAGSTQAWLLGRGPGPAVIRARQGQPLKLRFINDLDRDIWLHFFGVRGPAELMTINVPRGADHAVDCVFTPPDAGTFWIAPMSDQSRLRDMGLNAVLVVEELGHKAVQANDNDAELALVARDFRVAMTKPRAIPMARPMRRVMVDACMGISWQ